MHGHVFQRNGTAHDYQPGVHRKDCLWPQAYRDDRGHARRDARGQERRLRDARRPARCDNRRRHMGGGSGPCRYAQAEHEDARRRSREHAQRASRLPGLRSQDVVQAQPWEAQEGRHAGKDNVGLLLPAYFKSAWCQLHVQKPVPARVRGR